MKILIACEFSGRVRKAFRKRGFDAWSCDLLPAEDGSKYHIQDNVLNILEDGWDLMIAHPPCTYLANSGVRWLYNKDGTKNMERWKKLEEATDFFLTLLNAPIPHIAVENPIPHKYAREKIGRPTQYIQPYEFGENVSKRTGLWLKNLPPLKPTKIVEPEMTGKNGSRMSVFHYETYKLPPSERWKVRSKTFKGIAEAMAEQWGSYLNDNYKK